MDVSNIGVQTYRTVKEPQTEPLSGTPETNADEQVKAGHIYEHHDIKLEDMLSKSLDEINKKLSLVSNEMQYSYHKPTRTIAVKIFNTETKEVVREIPPQHALDAVARMWELAGIVLDEKG